MSLTFSLLALSVVTLLGLGYLVLKLNRFWVYRFFDRARKNDLRSLSPEQEQPRYFTLDDRGRPDFAARWPGWDGWYFSLLPDDAKLPLKMVRASLMTGLYGLDGVDDYEKLPLDLAPREAVEFLHLAPTEERVDGRPVNQTCFSQHYLPRASALRLKPGPLEVALVGSRVVPDEETTRYGRIVGRWPEYRFEFIHPEADLEVELAFRGEDVLWWADTAFFTYFAAFGRLDGRVIYKAGTERDAHALAGPPRTLEIRGRGFFEHGFARKPFDFDPLYAPVRWAQRVVPAFRPIRYHYELFLGEGIHGGFMKARGFGIDFRNRGGVFLGGVYREIERVQVDYPGTDPAAWESVARHCDVERPVEFPRRWAVKAKTAAGELEYTATRVFSAAPVSSSMHYYTFTYEGSYLGQPIQGRGYGEYLHV